MINRGHVWLQALPFQRFHVLCHSLSKVLFIFRSLYLCAIGLWRVFSFGRNVPPLRAAFPNNSTLRRGNTRRELAATYGILTLCDALFQGTSTAARAKAPSADYNSDARGRQISNLSCCRFTRRYWGNPCWFLFLRLLICLSSAGIPT